MRAKITIVGVGKRMQGIGKTSGKAYDFTELSFTYPDNNVNGLKAACVAVDQSIIEGFDLKVGDKYDCFMHFLRGQAYVDGLLKV